MKIVSIEPTPSPNSMKLNMDESLPKKESRNFNDKNKGEAPEYARKLLEIDGVKGLYHVADFIALEREGKVDWEDILPKARRVFGENNEISSVGGSCQSKDSYGAVQVFVQMFRGLPIQVKLLDDGNEIRFGLPERFMEAAMKAGEASENMIFERKWIEQGARYGKAEEIGENVVEEISAAYDEARLKELVHRAFQMDGNNGESAPKRGEKVTLEMLDDPNWKNRYAAMDQMEPTVEDLPVLEKALADPKMSIRRLAVVYLGMIESEAALPLLYRALKDQATSVRRTAGDCLSDLGNPDAIGQMCQSLKDPSRIVRWRAAMFLYEVGDASAIPALREAQNDPEFEVKMQVKMALERIEMGKEAEGSVWKQMTESVSRSE
ncbi:MAG TPA: conserved virulence factor C family protein [Bacillales bacterium]|nr:conserved virulence factor C family protein [Bacillales bacterium]